MARLLLQQGHRVTGSDMAPNGGMKELQKLGARIYSGHAGQNISEETELVVYTSAVGGENVELQAADELKILRVRRGLLLSALMNHPNNIAVAGTHGKTTTTAMIAYVLTRSDSAPSYCVGAHVPVLGANAQIGGGKYFVAEAGRERRHAGWVQPGICRVPEYRARASRSLRFDGQTSRDVRLIFLQHAQDRFLCADCPNCLALAAKCRKAITFGLSPKADYRALNIEQTKCGSRFTVACRDQEIGVVELTIPGIQNVTNALAAVAVADELGVPFEKIADALGQFTGATRRFDRKYEEDGILVVDDYAHHPTEIRATIAAARTMLAREDGAGLSAVDRGVPTASVHAHAGVAARNLATAFAGRRQIVSHGHLCCERTAHRRGQRPDALPDAVAAAGHADVVFEADPEMLVVRLFAEATTRGPHSDHGRGRHVQGGRSVGAEAPQRAGRTFSIRRNRPRKCRRTWRSLLSDKAKIRRDEPMARHTSMRVGGPAEFWIEPADERDLARLLALLPRSRGSGDGDWPRDEPARARWRHRGRGHQPDERRIFEGRSGRRTARGAGRSAAEDHCHGGGAKPT